MTPDELAKYYREEKLAGDHNPFPDRDGKRRSPVAFAAGVAWVEDGVATYRQLTNLHDGWARELNPGRGGRGPSLEDVKDALANLTREHVPKERRAGHDPVAFLAGAMSVWTKIASKVEG